MRLGATTVSDVDSERKLSTGAAADAAAGSAAGAVAGAATVAAATAVALAAAVTGAAAGSVVATLLVLAAAVLSSPPARQYGQSEHLQNAQWVCDLDTEQKETAHARYDQSPLATVDLHGVCVPFSRLDLSTAGQ